MKGFRGPGVQKPVPTTSPSVRFYSFADGGVLFLEGTRRIWALNAPSAYIWCLLEKNETIEELAESLADRFAIDQATALRDVTTTLACLDKEGLLNGEQHPLDAFGEEDRQGFAPCGQYLVQPLSWAVRCLFQTPNQVFEFCFQDASLGVHFAELVAHLGMLQGESQADTRLAVLGDSQASNGWEIYLDGQLFAGGVPQSEVLPNLFTLIFIRATEALREKLLFHAAVIGSEGGAVLFPAETGSGKTTLAAALAARGWNFYSDEIGGLDGRDLKVLPLALPMSIKPGSVEALAGYYPDLPARKMFRRPDGKFVRYLQPPQCSLTAGNQPAVIHALVFPSYRRGSATSLKVLEKWDALQRLARTGSSNREFKARDVEAMIAVVEQNPCYELTFSGIEDAVSLIEDRIFAISANTDSLAIPPLKNHREGSSLSIQSKV